jgi:hypothetical protein
LYVLSCEIMDGDVTAFMTTIMTLEDRPRPARNAKLDSRGFCQRVKFLDEVEVSPGILVIVVVIFIEAIDEEAEV